MVRSIRGTSSSRGVGVLIIGARDVNELLRGRDLEIVDCVEEAYRAHARGETSVPHSLFLRFPDRPADRIIALPAYVRAPDRVAGVKWVSSFPGNVGRGMERASAVMILNSVDTGRPEAIIEASAISAKRTAASAAAAARVLHRDPEVEEACVIGCGVINLEIVRFLLSTRRALRRLTLFDQDPRRARRFEARCLAEWGHLSITVAASIPAALAGQSLVSIATTAATPHLDDLAPCAAGAVVLHVSLRDIAPEVIARCDNVTDDVDHVCRAATSLDLASRLAGHRDFIRCTLGEILTGRVEPRPPAAAPVVFSPFGLGILDVTVAALVRRRAAAEGRGTHLDGFLPG